MGSAAAVAAGRRWEQDAVVLGEEHEVAESDVAFAGEVAVGPGLADAP